MKSLYLECNRGISGDMAVAALLDAGADENVLRKVLDSVKADGFKYKISRVKKSEIDCADFDVILDEDNHDHDMNYLFGKEDEIHSHHNHEHHHEEEQHGEAGHHHHEHDHEHHHQHRGIKEISEIISSAQMTETARSLALKIFDIIAESESAAHGIPKSEVHFHEVGALDSIVDVIALAVCFDNLGVEKVYVPYVCEGKGTIRCQHGILSVPVPAVSNIICSHGINLKSLNEEGEYVTPTGAAFVGAVKTDDQLPEIYKILKIGYGAGKREYKIPSVLRAFVIEENCSSKKVSTDPEDTIYKLETNIDDSTGEALGFLMEELMKAGARDVHYVPCFMKKNRPAYLMYVICMEKDISKLEELIFMHSTTIGIRRVKMERSVLSRKATVIKTEFGDVAAKEISFGNETRVYPEYESVASICRENNLPFTETYNLIKEMSII